MYRHYKSSEIVTVADIQSNTDTYMSKLSKDELLTLSSESSPVIYLAKRLAAKHALRDCLQQCDISFDDLTEVTIKNDMVGKPYFSFSDKVQLELRENNVLNIFISMSDERQYAFAYVTLTRLTDGIT